MSVADIDIREHLHQIADDLPEGASWGEAHYQLYIREKIAAGQKAGEEGRVTPHDEVKARFLSAS